MTVVHLGCGLDYHAGALNIDLYDLTAADLQADALRLPLPDASVAHIEACHLVEHLGYAGTIYALAEWLRVLKPGGTLLIETPDRIAACLAAAEPGPPAPTIHWLFGLSWAGYAHRTLFDEQELRTLVTRARWVDVASRRLDAPGQGDCVPPASILLTARKPREALSELRARLHVGFVNARIIEPLTAPPYLAHLERVCDSIISAVETCTQQNGRACLARVLGATARYTPHLTLAALDALVGLGFVSEAESEPFFTLSHSLASIGFPARLAACLRQLPALPGTQNLRLRRLHEQMSLYLTGVLHPREDALSPARQWFESDKAKPNTTDSEIRFFCPETVAQLSQRETARGVRAFARDELGPARVHFEAAIFYDVDNPIPLWNVARLGLSEGEQLEALESYAGLLELMPDAADLVRSELDLVTGRSMASLDSLMEPVQLSSLGETPKRTHLGRSEQ